MTRSSDNLSPPLFLITVSLVGGGVRLRVAGVREGREVWGRGCCGRALAGGGITRHIDNR